MTQPVRIDHWSMKRRFNCGGMLQRYFDGRLTVNVVKEYRPKPEFGFPPGTKSQNISLRDHDNQEVARVHRYLKLDGSLAASGYPEPKVLTKNGVEIHCYKGNTIYTVPMIVTRQFNKVLARLCRTIVALCQWA